MSSIIVFPYGFAFDFSKLRSIRIGKGKITFNGTSTVQYNHASLGTVFKHLIILGYILKLQARMTFKTSNIFIQNISKQFCHGKEEIKVIYGGRKIATTNGMDVGELREFYNNGHNFTKYSHLVPILAQNIVERSNAKYNDIYKELTKMVGQKKDDTYIYKHIYEFLHHKSYSQAKTQTWVDSDEAVLRRAMKRYKDFDILLNHLGIDIRYLAMADVGGSDGSFAYTCMNKYDLSKAICIDVVEPRNYDSHGWYEYINPIKEDYPVDCVDVCTCYMTLHHIYDYKDTLNKMKLMMKHGGIIVFREHAADTDDVKIQLDIIDKLFEYSLYEHPESILTDIAKTDISYFLSLNQVLDEFPSGEYELLYCSSIEYLEFLEVHQPKLRDILPMELSFNDTYYAVLKKK